MDHCFYLKLYFPNTYIYVCKYPHSRTPIRLSIFSALSKSTMMMIRKILLLKHPNILCKYEALVWCLIDCVFFPPIFGRKIGLQATFSAAQTLTAPPCTNLMHPTFSRLKKVGKIYRCFFRQIIETLFSCIFFESNLDLHPFQIFGSSCP